jgi:hypothetical protein
VIGLPNPRSVATVGLALSVCGCAGAADSAPPSASPAVTLDTSVATTSASPTVPPESDAPATFRNPVIDRDFADPHVVRFGDRFYAYATEPEENPILFTPFDPPAAGSIKAAGPGGQSIVEDHDGDLWMAYHAWDSGLVGYEMGGTRRMWIDELVWEEDRPVVKGPDAGPQARP